MSGAGAKVGASVCTQWFPRAYPKKKDIYKSGFACCSAALQSVQVSPGQESTHLKTNKLQAVSIGINWSNMLMMKNSLIPLWPLERSHWLWHRMASHGIAHKIYAWLDGLRSYSPQPLLERPQNGDHSTQAFASQCQPLQTLQISKQRVGLTHHPTDHTHSIRWWKFTQHLNVSTIEKDEQGRTETFLVDAVLQHGTVSCDSCHHMSRWKYLAHQVIDGVFLPRSPFL